MRIENASLTSRTNHTNIRRVVEPSPEELLSIEPRNNLLLDNLFLEDLIKALDLAIDEIGARDGNSTSTIDGARID
jgi:hypothetical protein